MAFLDNLGKKASEATSKAMQRAQDFSETAKLNSMISDEEKRIAAAYSQIGKLYVEIHREDGEQEFSELLGVIQDAEEKISSCRKQIQDMKRTLRCEKCGAEVSKDSAFCSSCGAQIVREKEPTNTPRCEKCGAPVTDWMRFCTVCGNPLPQPVNTEDAIGERTENQQSVIINVGGDGPAEPEETAKLPVTETSELEDIKADAVEPVVAVEMGESIIQPSEERTEKDQERQPQAVEPSVLQPTKRVCPHCGAEVGDDQLFCIECGNSL